MITPNSTIDDIISAAKVAAAHDFIMDLDSGYTTQVGERGTSLSGGQRQRLGIARALYTDPSVIILDEATNALDLKTENEILKSISKFKKNITIIMISHRLELIKRFD